MMSGGRSAGFSAVLIAATLAVAALAAAERPTRSVSGNLEGVFNGDVSPDRLPGRKPTRVNLAISTNLRTLDGSHLPALRSFRLEADGHIGLNVRGIPVCKLTSLVGKTTRAALEACRSAAIGAGLIASETVVSRRPFDLDQELLVFNGGVENGVTTLYVHTYLSEPISAAAIATVQVKKIRKGRIGLLAVAQIPPLAEGRGSITRFDLKLNKGAFGSCPDRRLTARLTAAFAGGARLESRLKRTCIPTSSAGSR